MPSFIALLLALPSASFAAELRSPFPSTVLGIDIPNTHEVASGKSRVLRGMMPRSEADVKQLQAAKITDILIFRNDVPGEDSVQGEMELLLKRGYSKEHIHQIPFKWKDIKGFEESCLQSLQALRIIKQALDTENKGLFFHCTVGEDRTGYLAGMYRIAFEGATAKQAFDSDMCSHGYAEGDPKKPKIVVSEVHAAITPLYLKMAYKFEKGFLSADKLNDSECSVDPAALDKNVADELKQEQKSFVCSPQKI